MKTVINPDSGTRSFLGRYQKPGFEWENSKTVVVPASSTKPAYFVLDGTPFEVTSDLECVCSSLLANQAYYLYAVESSGSVILTYSPVDPTVGPETYSKWTYVGAFCTDSATAAITQFQSMNGMIIFEDQVEAKTHTGDTNSDPNVFNSLPVTAKQAYVQNAFTCSVANQSGRITGTSTTSLSGVVQSGQVAAQVVRSYGWVSIFTSKTLYLRVSSAAASLTANLFGWMENPAEYR